MKTLAALFALTLAGTACQPQTAATDPAALPLAPVNYRPMAVPAPPAALSAADLARLRRYNIAALLQGREAKEGSSLQVLNGFFGPSGYRIELIFTSVQGDLQQPNVFRVRGKTRYKKVVTSFSGLITITKLVKQPAYTTMDVADYQRNRPRRVDEVIDDEVTQAQRNQLDTYTALGSYQLREDTTQRGAGVFRGTVALDLLFNPDGSTQEQVQTLKTSTQGGGLKYAGTWTNNATGRVQPVVWVHDIFGYQGPQVLVSMFLMGNRNPCVNPKYAKLGWNEMWDNDEWWVESGQPVAQAKSLP